MVNNFKRDGKWQGHSIRYNLSFNEEYNNGKLINGTSIDPSGNKYNYTVQMIAANYKGGIVNFWQYLAKTLRYPMPSVTAQRQGQLLVKFTIDQTGRPGNYEILVHGDKYMDEEALNAISSAKNWLPAKHYGKLVTSSIIVPIFFCFGKPQHSFGRGVYVII
ncbi:energy transducer TonB [Mucilaginibacter ginkgonis]|uniref:TonB family protein n=1 Tax=Mucilaginibacter ginkgonis TaxID=2682091 RepID=A0A6I4HZF5_9SPHI|nr:energy transducer TonB [Mucilaginibacter ginkgonis]QQL49357.1 TonB family protein [Mucilaginibacter ginkgonis]